MALVMQKSLHPQGLAPSIYFLLFCVNAELVQFSAHLVKIEFKILPKVHTPENFY